MKTSFSFFYTILTHQNNFLRHALRRISATQLRRNRLLLPQNTQIVSFRIFLCKNALILWNIKTNTKQKKVFSERLNREKIWEKKGIGAKGSTQNFLFLFVFNKLKFLSRFVHVLYKNGRQKAVFTWSYY